MPPRGMGNVRALDAVVRQGFAEEALSYLQALEEHHDIRIVEIAIDAPRTPAVMERRRAECVMDALGISCIATPSAEAFERGRQEALEHIAAGGAEARLPHANQIWMLVGFDLFRVLEGWRPCIEVFPQATVRAIAPRTVHKSKAAGLAEQTRAFAAAAGWNPDELVGCAHGALHDRLDALLSAWIASLPRACRVAYGDGDADTIWSVDPVELGIA